MQLSEFNFPFDPDLIATKPVLPRDQARLLLLSPMTHSLNHGIVADLPNVLEPGDLLVVNDTKVRSARVMGRKRSSGNPVEILFVKELAEGAWEVLMKGKWRIGQWIDIDDKTSIAVVSRDADCRAYRRAAAGIRRFQGTRAHAIAPVYKAATDRTGPRLVSNGLCA